MKVTDKYVFFWGDEPFTNFTPCKNLKYLDLDWKSTEQVFMWLKAVEFKDFEIAKKIRAAATPKEAKKLGRQVHNFDGEHWSSVSYDYMKMVVDIKFRSDPDFMKVLINPIFFDKTFVEASPYDRIWGIGMKESEAVWKTQGWGENRLGRILTELRDQYIEELKAVRV